MRVRRYCLPFAFSLLLPWAASATAETNTGNSELIAQGKYLAIAADCGACHNTPGGPAMGGGYAIASPLGNIIASNITPSKIAGIGDYSEADFARAVRQGINKQGQHLYPAMPYTSYGKITDGDIHALYVYFMQGVKADDTPAAATSLPFPFNLRASMALWNLLFADDKPFTPRKDVSSEVNRGDYLVNALAHCDTCHTPRNSLMGQDNSKALSGGSLGSWYAPNITPDATSGIGNWSDADLARYLQTGHVPGKAQAAGPMAEAVEHSLQYLSKEDINAMVAYLRQVPAVSQGEHIARDSWGQPSTDEARLRGASQVDAGWKVFSGTCANCHQPDGQGTALYPSLFHNSATGAPQADNLIATIVFGVHRTVQGEPIDMPAFGPSGFYTDRLSDRQIADVSNYVLKNYGNPAVKVTAQQVETIRNGGETPLLAKLARPQVWGSVLVVVLGLIFVALRRRGKKDGNA
ncbi:c-type cytochrome [Candidatus Pantoea multigeneris]|uniref:Cytochrome c n=1 Tax=Candidatus Pantoea multigeneris TaxID=2608357 RepID=A0ABX0R3P7_9GAMM|nr:cytochrome c [Pantoea multigeneris]NIF20025.1 cytochrome c [Pantoea multigeneris]